MAAGRPPDPGAGTQFSACGSLTPTRDVCTCGVQARACAIQLLLRGPGIHPLARGCTGRPTARAAQPEP